jgi:hypothetical protein
MKLRLQGNSLRLRLTQSEVARLHEHGVVEEMAAFSADQRLIYRVRKCAASDGIQADLRNRIITVHLPAGVVESWTASDEVGLYAQNGSMRIAIEKDFRCLTRSKEEEEADAYPHPAEQLTS